MMSNWINIEDQLPADGKWIIMEVQLLSRQIVYDIGYYLANETETYEEEEELIQVSSYSIGDNGEKYIPSGFYRVFTNWEGTHIHEIGGKVVRWKEFL